MHSFLFSAPTDISYTAADSARFHTAQQISPHRFSISFGIVLTFFPIHFYGYSRQQPEPTAKSEQITRSYYTSLIRIWQVFSVIFMSSLFHLLYGVV